MEMSPEEARARALYAKVREDAALPPGARSESVRRQLLLAFVANLTTLGAGLSLGFSAVALPPMRAADATPYVDEDQASWIASVAAIATPVGCLAAGPLLDRFGRRVALIAVNVPCLLGWVLIGAAPFSAEPGPASLGFLTQMYLGRALTGIATGMGALPATVYSAEMAQPNLRGLLVTWTSAAIALGVLVIYVLGWAFQERWRTAALTSALLPAGAGLLALLLPESPSWLAAGGRLEAAEAALRRARALPRHAPTPPSAREELRRAQTLAETRRQEAVAAAGNGGGFWARMWASVKSPTVWKPLVILNAFFFFQQVSGVFVVIFYAVDVARVAGVAIDPYAATVLIGVARFLVTVATGFVSQRFGRRPPALLSGAGMAACAAALAGWLWRAGAERSSSLTHTPPLATTLTDYVAAMATQGPDEERAPTTLQEMVTSAIAADTSPSTHMSTLFVSTNPLSPPAAASLVFSNATTTIPGRHNASAWGDFPGFANASAFIPSFSDLSFAASSLSNASAALLKLPSLSDAISTVSNASATLPSLQEGIVSLTQALGRGGEPLLPAPAALEASDPTLAPATGWLPAAALLLYIATSTVGFLTLPWAMLGELFPASARGLAGGFTTCVAYVFSFIMLKLYPAMLGTMGPAGLFLFYSLAAVAGTLFVAAFLPETRGRTLHEIEEMFAGSEKTGGSSTRNKAAGEEPRAVEMQPLARAS